MAVTAVCACGKRTVLGDVMAGRTIRCGKCGGDVTVPGGAAKPAAGGKAAAKGAKAAGPAVAVSPTLVIGGGIGAVVLAAALALYFGPWRVGNEWAALSPKANSDVTDVVMFALQAHQSQNVAGSGGGGAMTLSKPPAIEGGANFIPPAMAFTLPQHMVFSGATSQGGYIGTYDTTTGDVVADVEVGGYTVGGLVAMRKATEKIHVTGREKDGTVTAEEDGTPMKIITPRYRGRHGDE